MDKLVFFAVTKSGETVALKPSDIMLNRILDRVHKAVLIRTDFKVFNMDIRQYKFLINGSPAIELQWMVK